MVSGSHTFECQGPLNRYVYLATEPIWKCCVPAIPRREDLCKKIMTKVFKYRCYLWHYCDLICFINRKCSINNMYKTVASVDWRSIFFKWPHRLYLCCREENNIQLENIHFLLNEEKLTNRRWCCDFMKAEEVVEFV